MKLKRFLAVALTLCMLLSLALPGAALAEDSVSTENLAIQRLNEADYDLDLTRDDGTLSDTVRNREEIDGKTIVKVIIVMEGDSIIEDDSSAVMDSRTQAMAEKLEENQADVVAQIEENALAGETLEVSYNYTWLLNGVAAQVPYGSLADIAAVEGVKQVLLQPVYEICDTETTAREASPMTIFDGVMIGRESTWADGYTGKGIKIAIVDTGIDTEHPNFAPLSDDKLTDASATPETVEAVLSTLNASARYESGLTVDDVYYSSKIAFGFNYCDDNTDITHKNDTQGDHGTHVAGIAAASKAEGSDVVGVAPDAQLYVMKVFGRNGGAYTEDILAALEDALILGADVVNLSLCSPAGFTSDGEEIDAIYNRVAGTNTVLSISCGNNYTSALGNLWGTDANLTANPDNATVGSPGTYANVLSVASVENLKLESHYIDADGYLIGYTEGTNTDETGAPINAPLTSLTGEYELVAVPGYGEVSDYECLDVTGKVALVQRGVTNFSEKCDNAADAGAVACLVYNNTTGAFGMDLSGAVSTIPCVSITMAGGSYLLSALEENPSLTVSFPEEAAFIPNEEAYRMSEFSSWGLAPDLTLEPDITAPGGNIYSTLDGGSYGLMSGTSMAAPNVAGISALVMQYVRENFDPETTDYRTLVRVLLMSTSTPLTYDGESGLFYSPRSQGSGLANAYNAISTPAYLTIEGCDTPKAELGSDPDRTGAYRFTFQVRNFGDKDAFYSLSTVSQTEDYLDYGVYFMSSTPRALDAATAESSANLVLTFDVDNSAATNSHDAYLIYLAASGKRDDADWTEEAFRYDLNGDESVTTDDVQAYLDTLVGKDASVDLEDTVLRVGGGETADVSVSIDLADTDRDYLNTVYPNGGYVEGFTFLTARNAGGVDLSLPYLAFYGNWNDAPVLDDGFYWDLFNAEDGEVIGNQYINFLYTNFYGMESVMAPGMNTYVDEPFDISHISVSPDGDGYFDTVDDMEISLLRNASSLTFRYTNMDTGEVCYEQTLQNVSKSVYNFNYGQIVPFVYSWLESDFGLPLYDWTDPEGNALTNNTRLLLEVEATGVPARGAEAPEAESWSVPITVDLEAPMLTRAKKLVDLETGEMTLELTFRDNLAVSVVALLSSDGSEIYAMDAVADTEPDADGYQNYTVSYDITGHTGKMMIVLSDYAINEAYYGINLSGEGTPYGEFVAYQYDVESDINGWVSFDADVNNNETQISMDGMNFVCAEYVGGYVLAQTETGALYGLRYTDMLADTLEPECTFIAQLDNVYQDLAFNYGDGKLYGLHTYEDDWGGEPYPTSEIFSINLKGAYYDEELWMDMEPYQEDWVAQRGNLYGLSIACDDDGSVYILGTVPEEVYNEETGAFGYTYSTAQLWKASMEEDWWGGVSLGAFRLVGDTGMSMDYLQSMTWNHNTEELYWTRFDASSWIPVSELIRIDPATAACEKVGTLSGETCALFVPLSAEAAAMENHSNIPDMDSSQVGRPILRESLVTMNVGGVKKLSFDFDPWYTDHKDVVWSSNNADVVTVDENGVITAVAQGSAIITVAARDDAAKFSTCNVEVTALSLKLEGIISAQSAGIGNVTGVSTYEFVMDEDVPTFGTVNKITASEELNYGLALATSAYGRGSIWASEYGNTGMVYEIDPDTGAVKDVLEPIDGSMIFGLTYSESTDAFTAIMNMHLFVDISMTDADRDQMMESYDEETNEYTWHNINMLPYLIESNTGFVTGEDGNGASSEIVFCGITGIDGGIRDIYGETYFYDTYKDYLGNWAYGGSVNYQPTQTLVLLDNVGRLWYIDEITGMTLTEDDWGNQFYNSADGASSINGSRKGVIAQEIVDKDGNSSYSVFYIRQILETPLTDMFREGTMPRITYHFSDIEFAGYTAEGDPIYAMSLYDYWNSGITNELYLYIPGHETDEMDYETGEPIRTPDRLFDIGNTGEHNIIASIHTAEVTGGLDTADTGADAETGAAEVGKLAVGRYSR